MAISKKGMRTIVVEGKDYYWKFNEKIFIFPEEEKNDLLIVEFGWYDRWLRMEDPGPLPDFTPSVVTPRFVSEAILFACENGWEKGKMELSFYDEAFRLKE